ncbi:hypothetical protein CYMTET_35051 [Cymbomonas tetramitiformis]|uniref:Uncharacterized protein n=1 Tax=Cymbomonas tetramitiformis TaxID=36881 RepID=A0AAE0FAE4_9CHLO|nr:hypothetical protein CYMTET_35051 [Cymbomonas tetramitiformis]
MCVLGRDRKILFAYDIEICPSCFAGICEPRADPGTSWVKCLQVRVVMGEVKNGEVKNAIRILTDSGAYVVVPTTEIDWVTWVWGLNTAFWTHLGSGKGVTMLHNLFSTASIGKIPWHENMELVLT